jgi:outer membrane protein assembly factor BamE (lipoprotein component of BamABCDE complex)
MKRSVICLVALAACHTTDGMKNLRVGMTRDEALRVMGNPDAVSAEGDTELLDYRLRDGMFTNRAFAVELRDGRVTRFGRRAEVVPKRDP